MLAAIRKLNTNHIIVFSIILTLITLLIGSAISWDDNPIMGYDKLLCDILISLFCIMFIFILGIQKTAGFQWSGLGKGLLFGIPFILIGIAAAFVGNIGMEVSQLKMKPVMVIVLFTVNMLLVGVNEELTIRALLLNNLMLKYGNEKKNVVKALIIASLIFGGIHLINIFFMAPISVIVQAINAASAGILFGTIFICSKNIWACVITHAAVDWISLFIGQCFTGGSSVLSMEISIGLGLTMIVLGSLPPILIAVLYLRRYLK